MAPDAPIWQAALVAAGAGLIGTTLKHISRRTAFKAPIDFVMFTILIWQGLMVVYFFYVVGQPDYSSFDDLPMWRVLLVAAALTLVGQFLFTLGRRRKQIRPSLSDRLSGEDVR